MASGLSNVEDGAWGKIRHNFARIKKDYGASAIPVYGGITITGLTDNSLIYPSGGGTLTSLGVASNGQIPIGSTGTTPVLATITGTANEIDVTNGAGSITIGLVNPLIVAKGGTGVATLTDHGILLGSGTDAVTPLGVASNGQIPIGSTGVDPVLAEITGTANQITSTPGAGSITLSTPQDIHTGASPTFAGGTFTGVTTGVTPTAGTHLATKEYVDLSLGTRKTFFLSDTAGVGALEYAYPHETGEAESTIVSAGMGEGAGQLVNGWITEAGQPATTTLHEGVINIHIHAKKGASNHRITTLYAIISTVDANGTSNKATVATSEVTAELTDAETAYGIHATFSGDVEVAATSRLICDVYANVTTGALDSVVTLYLEGEHDSYFTMGVDSGIWQNHGDVLDDLNTVGQVASDGQMLVGTGVGAFAWESGATLRTSIGVDAAGLVTSHESTYNHGNYNDAYSHVSADGSSHSIVGSNTTAIGLNTDHRGLTSGNPHTVTPTELSLVIGTNTQAWDAGLDNLAALTYVSDSFIKVTATDTYAIRTITETKTDLNLNNVSNVATSDVAYNAGTWDANTDASTKNAIRDKFVINDAAIGLNTTHRGSNGSDHSYLDQAVTIAASPIFAGLDLTGITDGNIPYMAAAGAGFADSPLSIDGTTVVISAADISTLRLTCLDTDVILDEIISSIDTYNSDSSGSFPGIATRIVTISEQSIGTHFGLAFYTTQNQVPPTEKVRIDHTGAVGINTTTPDALLQVVGDCKFGDDNTNYIGITATGNLSFTGSARLDLPWITDGNVPYMAAAAAGFADSPLSTDGTDATFSGRIYMSGNAIAQTTSDGSDNSRLSLCGGGTDDTARGGMIRCYGNESGSNPGRIWLYPGNRAGGDVEVITNGSLFAATFAYGGNTGLRERTPETLLELTHSVPYITLHNSSHEDTDGGRESRLIFKGEQSGEEETTLAWIQVSHDGVADDQKGQLQLYTNDGNDGVAPTLQVTIAADGGIHVANLKSGTDQADAGAAAGELYSDTNDDNTVKIGV